MENNIICERIKIILNDIFSTIKKRKRTEQNIEIMAVTKNASIDQILMAQKCGINLFGENYLKDAINKIPTLLNYKQFDITKFHCIGHLQTNKIKKALSLFSSIDSVDTIYLAKEINQNISSQNISYPIMLEVKTSKEESKFGFIPEEIIDSFGEIFSLKNIRVIGLMTIATWNDTEKETRRCFSLLKKIKEKIETTYKNLIPFLSMGMSEDYKIAIEEGSNMLRLGRAIFGG